MNEANTKPVIFLPETSGQDRVKGSAYLRSMPIELDGIRQARKSAKDARPNLMHLINDFIILFSLT